MKKTIDNIEVIENKKDHTRQNEVPSMVVRNNLYDILVIELVIELKIVKNSAKRVMKIGERKSRETLEFRGIGGEGEI